MAEDVRQRSALGGLMRSLLRHSLLRHLDAPRVFAALNLLPAYVLGAGCYILPARYWPVDVSVALVVAVLVGSSAVALAKPRLARRALRIAAIALLCLGLGLFAVFCLTAVFLHSVHNSYGELGAILMSLVLLLITPYALAYPGLLLIWLARDQQSLGSGLGTSRPGV